MTVITQAFTNAAMIRARTLGMPDHPIVVVEHPIASRTEAEMSSAAERALDVVCRALVRAS